MLIQARFREAIASGAVTLTFRRWKRPQVVAGNTYRTAAGRIVVDAVHVVDPERITDALTHLVPNRAQEAYDMHEVIRYVVDDGEFLEVSPLWDPSGRTAVTAAAILREAILSWWAK